jgi:hypothetical protein
VLKDFSQVGERPGREANHSPSCRADVKKWNSTSTPSIRIHSVHWHFIFYPTVKDQLYIVTHSVDCIGSKIGLLVNGELGIMWK